MLDSLQHINSISQILLGSWMLFIVFSIVSFYKSPKFTSLFLFLSAVSIAAAVANFTTYFFPWDEQFHALVGKHLAENPLFPKLYPSNPLGLKSSIWADSVIWLHKQPLFTWQMALSIKLIGNSVFAVRLPSVIFHGLLVVSIYRIGVLILNRKVGFIAALLVMHSTFLLGLLSGRIGTDHNDFVFLGYITFSFWAWFEFQRSDNRKWLFWIGIFAGCAILTKWLVGLLVFGVWGFVLLHKWGKSDFWKALRDLLLSLAIACLVFIPWQVYTFVYFPEEAAQEMNYNSKHLTHAVELHGGDVGFHFEQIQTLYFNQFEFFIFLFLGIFGLFKTVSSPIYRTFILVSIGMIYLFFTIVPTKMPAFPVPVSGLVMLIIAVGIVYWTNRISKQWLRRSVTFAVVLLLLNWMLKPAQTLAAYGFKKDSPEFEGRLLNQKRVNFIQHMGKDHPTRIVFGVNQSIYMNLSWMYFHDEIAYPFEPSEDQIQDLLKRGFSVAIVTNDPQKWKQLQQKYPIQLLYLTE